MVERGMDYVLTTELDEGKRILEMEAKAKQSYFFYSRCDLGPDFLVPLPLR
jgi:hypothetical protein